MRRICFLSTDNLDGYTFDDDLAIGPLKRLGWSVDTISWRDKSIDWNGYEAVILRTTWDYQQEPEEFIHALAAIDASSARLENPLDMVRWNLSKKYLRDIEGRGCRIVPTIWNQTYTEEYFSRWRQLLGTDELIIKPLISATAQHTYRLKRYDDSLAETFRTRDFMVQPFMPAIVTEGEYSLFYFGGEFSHAINKAPKAQDFRVQEEHGGLITAFEPEARLLKVGRKALALIEQELLYARADFVRDSNDEFALMELELIEPALYFRMDPRSPELFAKQFDRRMNEL
ncbi:MAG: hypothetical protein HOP17_00180 [Acidobacteria bacterium]|nr:hypothetical protein [Acidobacteriota bacterium]